MLLRFPSSFSAKCRAGTASLCIFAPCSPGLGRLFFLYGMGKRPKWLFHDCCTVFTWQIWVKASQLIGKHWKSRLGVHPSLSPLLGRNETRFLLVRHFQFTANYKYVGFYHWKNSEKIQGPWAVSGPQVEAVFLLQKFWHCCEFWKQSLSLSVTHRSDLPPEQQGRGQRPIVGICGPARCEDGKFSGNTNIFFLLYCF